MSKDAWSQNSDWAVRCVVCEFEEFRLDGGVALQGRVCTLAWSLGVEIDAVNYFALGIGIVGPARSGEFFKLFLLRINGMI